MSRRFNIREGVTAMNHQIKSYRRKHGISLDLKVGYLHVWEGRMPNVLQMVEHGLNLREIGKHYGCHAVSVSMGMKGQGYSIRRVRRDFQLNKH